MPETCRGAARRVIMGNHFTRPTTPSISSTAKEPMRQVLSIFQIL
jgi:hypothetical protein